MSLVDKYPRLSETEDFNLKHVIACVLTARGIGADSGLVAELSDAVEEFYAPPVEPSAPPEPEPEPAPSAEPSAG